jgi:hypothetical protein
MDYMSSKMEVNPSSGFAYDLVNRVARGEIVPAKFQRPYVWSKDDVLALFNSILMGISIGSFLIWEPSSDMDIDELGRDRLGPTVRNKQTGYRRPTGILLDGQNRLATIAWARHVGPVADEVIAQMSPQEKAIWGSGEALVLDFTSGGIRFVPEAEAEVGLRLPLSAVIAQDFKVLRIASQRWEREMGIDTNEVDGMIKLYEHCGRRFMGARAADITITNATVEEAREAFLNICRVGVPMSQEDFDNAVQWKAPK